MNNYVIFDSAKFLKDSKTWKKRKAEIKQKIEELTYIGGVGTSSIKSNEIGNPTQARAIKLLSLEDELKRIENLECQLSNALEQMTPRNKEILTQFFFSKTRKDYVVQQLAVKYQTNRQYIYNERKKALDEFGRIITK